MLIENAMDNKPKPLQHGRQGLRTFSAFSLSAVDDYVAVCSGEDSDRNGNRFDQ